MQENILAEAMQLYKVLLDKHARKNNCNVTFLSQHSVLWGIQSQQSHQGLSLHSNMGVCAGLAIEWIKATAKGTDFMAAMGRARNEVFTQGKSQGFSTGVTQLLDDVDDSHSEQNNISKAFPGGSGKETVSLYPFKGAAKAFSPDNYYYISSGTHAVAAYCSGSKIDFYDPNVGLVKGASKKLVEEYMSEAVIKTHQLILNNQSPDLSKKSLTITHAKP